LESLEVPALKLDLLRRESGAGVLSSRKYASGLEVPEPIAKVVLEVPGVTHPGEVLIDSGRKL